MYWSFTKGPVYFAVIFTLIGLLTAACCLPDDDFKTHTCRKDIFQRQLVSYFKFCSKFNSNTVSPRQTSYVSLQNSVLHIGVVICQKTARWQHYSHEWFAERDVPVLRYVQSWHKDCAGCYFSVEIINLIWSDHLLFTIAFQIFISWGLRFFWLSWNVNSGLEKNP